MTEREGTAIRAGDASGPGGEGPGGEGSGGTGTDFGGAGAYRVEVVRGVDALPDAVWEALAPPDDPMWSRGLFASMERGAIGPEGYAYLVARRGADIVAVLPLCLFRDLRLDDVVGPKERRLLAPVRKVFPRLLRIPMLLCGNLLGQGHLLSAGPPPREVVRLMVDAVMRFARSERLGTVVFKDFAPAELAPLRGELSRAGFFFVPSMPDTQLTLGHGSFEEYVTSLPAKPRRNLRSKARKFEARDDLRVEVVDDFAALLPQFFDLYRQVMDRADQTLDSLDPTFLAAVEASGQPRRRLVACFQGDRLVAFLLCLFSGKGATGARIGLDYRLAHDARLYHVVHYAAIRLALESGCAHIRFAQTAYTPKVEFGCDLIPQVYAVTHVRPAARAVLRRVLPAALSAALAETLGPHAALLDDAPASDGRPASPTDHRHDRSASATDDEGV
ncbi:GNAT family N-acetyltransferase [Streptantibioticus parmotrematis]|uniref:GNAT family N-acetyltransferase n=1 Tax=Streptantibioticus parmotrematis TaxID=2873249 RepID=UPI003402A1DB